MSFRSLLLFALAFTTPAAALATSPTDPADTHPLTDDAPFAAAEKAQDDEEPLLTDELYNAIDAPPTSADRLEEQGAVVEELLDDGLPPPPDELAVVGFLAGLVGAGSTVGLAATLVMGTGLTTMMAMSCCSAPKWTYTIGEVGMYAIPLLLPLMLAIPPLAIALALWWADAGWNAVGAAAIFSGLAFVAAAPFIAGAVGMASIFTIVVGAELGMPLGPTGAFAGGVAGAGVAVIGISVVTGLDIGAVAAGGAAWGGGADESRALAKLYKEEDDWLYE